jgi:hypothetical protein
MRRSSAARESRLALGGGCLDGEALLLELDLTLAGLDLGQLRLLLGPLGQALRLGLGLRLLLLEVPLELEARVTDDGARCLLDLADELVRGHVASSCPCARVHERLPAVPNRLQRGNEPEVTPARGYRPT